MMPQLAHACLPNRQRGQLAIFALLVLLPAVLLVAVLTSTAQQSWRKQEMQGAADAGAVAAATTVARGFNVIAASNKGMAEVLAVMVAVRSLKETARLMYPIAAAMAAAAVEVPPLAAKLEAEMLFYREFQSEMQPIDNRLSDATGGVGWETMRGLDRANQAVKAGLPFALEAAAVHYASSNGADRFPAAYVFGDAPMALPRMPLGRGGKEFIAGCANECAMSKVHDLAAAYMFLRCSIQSLGPCITFMVAEPILSATARQLLFSLGATMEKPGTTVAVSGDKVSTAKGGNGRTVQDMIDEENGKREGSGSGKKKVDTTKILQNRQYNVGGSMEWPQNPPLPMMLAVDAQPAGNWEIPDVYGTLNANKVHRDLQFLAISRGSPPIQVLGGDWLRAGHLGSLLAYGQAEVFNPKDWYMFDQNWRARLTRASLLERKLQDVSSKLGLPAGGVVPSILRQVNLH